MQMICAEGKCDWRAEVEIRGPVNFICPQCGNTQVIFDADLSIIDPNDKQVLGRLKAGRPINAEELRDIRTGYRRAFLLEPLRVMEPPKKPEEPPPPEDPVVEDTTEPAEVPEEEEEQEEETPEEEDEEEQEEPPEEELPPPPPKKKSQKLGRTAKKRTRRTQV